MSQSTPDTPDSPALTWQSHWGWTQNTMARVTSLRHLEGKPPIPMSTWQEAWDYCYRSKLSRLACLALDEAWLPCWNSTGSLRSMSTLERKPEVLASAPDEDLGASNDWRGIPRIPSQQAWRLDFPEAIRAGPWGPRHNSRGIPSFLLQLEKNQEILPLTRDEALFRCRVSREIPPSLLSLERVLDTLDATQEVLWHARVQLRWIQGIWIRDGVGVWERTI